MPSGRWKGSDRRGRLPADWKAPRGTKAAVYALYGDICHLCGLPGADSIDHVTPGDDHSLENLRPAHDDPCHRQKSAREGVEARARKRASIRRPPEPHPGLLR